MSIKNKNFAAINQELTSKKMEPFRSSFKSDLAEIILLIAAVSIMLAMLFLGMMNF